MSALAERLPEQIFSAAQVRELERLAIETHGVTDYELMCRAAAGALRRSEQRWPSARSLVIVCGAGNNAGDGLVMAMEAGGQIAGDVLDAVPGPVAVPAEHPHGDAGAVRTVRRGSCPLQIS